MRPIDADALPHDFTVPRLMDSRAYFKGVQDVFETIDAAPTVDAVAVVRCRDCRWSKPVPDHAAHAFNTELVRDCTYQRGDWKMVYRFSVVAADGYCDEGERKEPANGRTD